jgi:hypothetical protein
MLKVSTFSFSSAADFPVVYEEGAAPTPTLQPWKR